jgi:hypothetical protein
MMWEGRPFVAFAIFAQRRHESTLPAVRPSDGISQLRIVLTYILPLAVTLLER